MFEREPCFKTERNLEEVFFSLSRHFYFAAVRLVCPSFFSLQRAWHRHGHGPGLNLAAVRASHSRGSTSLFSLPFGVSDAARFSESLSSLLSLCGAAASCGGFTNLLPHLSLLLLKLFCHYYYRLTGKREPFTGGENEASLC